MLDKKTRLEMYGVKEDIEVYGAISKACSIFGNGSRNNANLNLEKCCRVESHLANYPDYRPEYGESPFQIDEPTFDWIKDKLINDLDYREDIEKLDKHYNIDIYDVEYKDLRNNIDISAALARLRYRFIEEVFPITDYEQFLYYKKWWNSSDGDGDYEHWKSLTKECYFG